MAGSPDLAEFHAWRGMNFYPSYPSPRNVLIFSKFVGYSLTGNHGPPAAQPVHPAIVQSRISKRTSLP